MAITGVPGWIGSSAAAETGQRWMSAAGGKIRLPTPFWMSQMAGKGTFNCVLYPETYSHRTSVGYFILNNGTVKGQLNNNTGIPISTMQGCLGDRWNIPMWDSFMIQSHNSWYSGIRAVLEGFNGNEVLTLTNSGAGNSDGRAYIVNGRADIFWWLKNGGWRAINVLVEPF